MSKPEVHRVMPRTVTSDGRKTMISAARSTGDVVVGRNDNDEEPRTEAGRALLTSARAEARHGFVSAAMCQEIEGAILAIEREAATPPSPAAGGLREALKDLLNLAALTYSSVPQDGSRPHWCSFPPPRHDATCAGMMKVQDNARAALASGASSETAGLDVERLARALRSVNPPGPDAALDSGIEVAWRAWAEDIADVYARLTPVAGSASEEAGRR